MKNHHLDLIKVTEAGAIAAAAWVGRGDKEQADKAATDAIYSRLMQVDFTANIAMSEGVKDKSYTIPAGQTVGNSQNGPYYDIVLDPIEGTSPTAKGGYEAMSVIALGNKDAFYQTEHFYMSKLAVGPRLAHAGDFDLGNPLDVNLSNLAMVLQKPLHYLTVCILDRPRHQGIVNLVRQLGCRIKFIADCDVTACIATCMPDSGIDVYFSIGGATEAVLAAAAMKCLGGKLQTMLVDEDFMPIDNKILNIDDLAKDDVMFSATGITDGQLLKGVQFTSKGPVTHSITMRSESKTIRRITTEHGN